jgi:hypothetical protein
VIPLTFVNEALNNKVHVLSKLTLCLELLPEEDRIPYYSESVHSPATYSRPQPIPGYPWNTDEGSYVPEVLMKHSERGRPGYSR